MRRRRAAGPMEARGELGPSRESAGGDLLLALLARREDLRRGGCSGGIQRPRRIEQTLPRETQRSSQLSSQATGPTGPGGSGFEGPSTH